jgi:hypothetical protein
MRLLGSPKRIILLLLSLIPLTLCALALAYSALVAGSGFGLGPFAHDEMYVPDYPSAQQAQVMVKPVQPWDPYKTVAFDTSDPPSTIFTFYKTALAQRGFEDWRVDSARVTSDTLHIFGFDNRNSGPMYLFDVKTQQSDGLTHVTVELSFEPGR